MIHLHAQVVDNIYIYIHDRLPKQPPNYVVPLHMYRQHYHHLIGVTRLGRTGDLAAATTLTTRLRLQGCCTWGKQRSIAYFIRLKYISTYMLDNPRLYVQVKLTLKGWYGGRGHHEGGKGGHGIAG